MFLSEEAMNCGHDIRFCPSVYLQCLRQNCRKIYINKVNYYYLQIKNSHFTAANLHIKHVKYFLMAPPPPTFSCCVSYYGVLI